MSHCPDLFESGPRPARGRGSLPLALAVALVLVAHAGATPVAKKVVGERAAITDELLANGNLDRAAGDRLEGWSPYEGGYELARGPAHTGDLAAVCDNPTGEGRMGLSQTLALNRADIRPLIAAGWSKAENVPGTPNADYAVYVDIIYQDDTPLWGRTAQFTCGTHDWEYREVRIIPEKPVKRVSVYALFRGRQGKVWFDDISLREGRPLPGVIMFDGAAVDRTSIAARRPAGRPEVHVRDVAADSHFYLVRGEGANDGRVEVAELQLAVTTRTSRAAQGSRRMDIAVEDLAKRDRAITIYYAVPVPAAGRRWHDNVRESRLVEPEGVYQNVLGCGVGATGQTSRYPFACVSGANDAYSLLVPEPRVYRLAYDARAGELYAAFDAALTQDSKTPGRATMAICDQQTDPRWGLRAAAELFYALLPDYFDRARVPKSQGNWMAFTRISSVQQPEDFHFAVHEGDNDVRWDNDHAIQAYVYVEPMTWWMSMPKELPRTYEAALDYLRSFLDQPQAPNSARAWAVELSGIYDRDGRPHLDVLNAPWCDGAVFANSADPDVPEREGHLNLAHLNLRNLENALGRAEAQGGLAGVYLDSLEGWGTLKNYRREHFAASDLPLTFDSETHQPVILNAFATQEWTEFICRWVRERGKLLMANAVPHNFPFLALPIDVMGTETDWQRDGRVVPPSTDYLYLKRTLSWQKPYMFLMNSHYETWTAAMTERYMQICAFYGMFPGFFSENASTNCYFDNPTWYNRDRPLFKRYLPIIKQVAEAGWQPITLAQTDAEGVWVERWGQAPDTGLYFTVMNTTTGNQTAELRIELEQARGREVVALLGGEAAGRAPRLTLDLAPEAVEVLQVRP